MRARAIVLTAVAVAGVAAGSRPIAAQPVAIESYAGRRPITADALMEPVLAELEARGFRVGPRVALAIEANVSRPGASDAASLTDQLSAQVAEGFNAWINGEFDRCISLLGPLVERVHASPAVIAENQDIRLRIRQALVALAMAHERKGNTDQAETYMAEVVRSFPDTELSRVEFGPEVHRLYERVETALRSEGRGRLVVEADEPTAVIYINERFVSVGRAEKDDLLPGTYRVYVTAKRQRGRVYRATVEAGGQTKVSVWWEFDAALRTDEWIGFEFADTAVQHEHETDYATRLARMLDASAIAVLGVGNYHGKPVLMGSVLSLETKRPLRSATLALDPDPPVDKLRALAAFLSGDEPAEGLTVLAGGVAVPPAGKLDRGSRAGSALGQPLFWAATVGAVAGLVAGGVLLAIDDTCVEDVPAGVDCLELYDTKWPGVGAIGAGLALGGVATYLWIRARGKKRASPVSAIVAPGRVQVTAGWRF